MSAAVHRGVVKQVLSGDCVVIRDKPRGGPPPERTVAISNIVAPRLARRPPLNATGERFQADSKDEPMAWAAREFLRKKVIGREVCFTVEHKTSSSREYGYIYLGKEQTGSENLAESIVAEGYAEVRRGGGPGQAANEQHQKLVLLEEAAKAAGKGKWAPDASTAGVRNCLWTVDNPVAFVEVRHGRAIPAIVEHVRDGCTVRVCLLPTAPGDNTYYHLMLMLSGIKTPGFKTDGASQTPEPYAEEARYFVESRLLQREVQVMLETSSNQNMVGSILHPNGNITELLLKEGYARCVDWSMGVVSCKGGAETLRASERAAKEKKLRLWKDWQGGISASGSGALISSSGGSGESVNALHTELAGKTFTGKVVEVGNGDNLLVKQPDGKVRKFFLASVRPPRPLNPAANAATGQPEAPTGGRAGANTPKSRSRPLYDIPHMFEAREFLRKKLIGKKVSIRVDYVQPKNETGMDERVCATALVGELNVAEALVSKGLASVVRYRATDENRSSAYDQLLAAEAVAQKKAVGIHSRKEQKALRIADISGDLNKAKNFLPFLKRGGRLEAVVEYVAGGSRMRLYVPRETCLITMLCAGIDCPRAPRRNPDGTSEEDSGDKFGQEAYLFTKELCMQREVEIEVDSMDKGGNYIGWIYCDTAGQGMGASGNLSVALVENGLAKVHFTAERTNHYTALSRAEDKAKESRLGVWTLEENQKELVKETSPNLLDDSAEDAENGGNGDAVNGSAADTENGTEKDLPDRKTAFKKAFVTVVCPGLRFFFQYVDSAPHLEKLTRDMHTHLTEHPPLSGAYTPRKGDVCAAKFIDDCWYRARVRDVSSTTGKVSVFYLDFGNEEVTTASRMASLPASFTAIPGEAHEARLAYVEQPPDEEDKDQLTDELMRHIAEKEVKVNVEYDHTEGGRAVTIMIPSGKKENLDVDVAELLLKDGYLFAERRRDRRLKRLMTRYNQLQDEAMRSRRNIWRYGDVRADDAL